MDFHLPKKGYGVCGTLLIGLSHLLFVFTLPFSLFFCLKIIQEYERAVILRLGRIAPDSAKGPGLVFTLPCIDAMIKCDLRTVSFDVPSQEILTKDSVTITVDAVCYYQTKDPITAVINVENAQYSTQLLAATCLRNILGTKTLQEILQDRESVDIQMQILLDEATKDWGIIVERIEIKDVSLPEQMQRAMAAEAEASREAMAKVITAEGEQKASSALKLAADIIDENPIALQLRYLQTLTNIAAERNSTIIFPIPIDFLNTFTKKK
ncbi:unnamed protein product [Brachionus calyciflorus]|uniref:Band 7 domain-containing protein n=1 Tax=Brachionus calyciflorus TaxID=104777 RepID=A0A814CNW8_9BILA|nr:unnamed protein product [Brachionus calyciflorus]